MKSYIKTFDNLPWILKLIFALPGLDFLWGLYRLFKGITKKNLLLTIIGIIWIFAGTVIFWLIDIITIILSKKPTVFVD